MFVHLCLWHHNYDSLFCINVCMYANTQLVPMRCRHSSKLGSSPTFKLNDAYASSAAAVTMIFVFCCAPSHLNNVNKADSSISRPLTPRHEDTQSDRSGQSRLTKTKEQCRQRCPIGILPSRGCKANFMILL